MKSKSENIIAETKNRVEKAFDLIDKNNIQPIKLDELKKKISSENHREDK